MSENYAAASIGSKFTGKHQGFADLQTGTYWEACYVLTGDELKLQLALIGKGVKFDNRKSDHQKAANES